MDEIVEAHEEHRQSKAFGKRVTPHSKLQDANATCQAVETMVSLHYALCFSSTDSLFFSSPV
jgi:hypothetical protein